MPEYSLRTRGKRKALAVIASSQLLALGLWFSLSAVAPQLREEWRLSVAAEAGLTLTVQLGFVVGALLSAVYNIADVVPSRRLFVMAAIGGAVANSGILLVDGSDVGVALALRFLTGVFLAGVYPAGLKVMSGWFKSDRGMALGALVGALTVGSASPHLVRGVGLDWQGVVVAASALALVASLLMSRLDDGPYEVPAQGFKFHHLGRIVADRGFRLSTYGYVGHMWELYAMWTWLAAFLTASAMTSSTTYGSISLITFVAIAIGGPSSWLAGVVADRFGRTRVAGTAMVVSGSCAALTPLIFGTSIWVILPFVLIWGLTVIPDSAQFSAMVTETVPEEMRGTALTLQTALGFLVTLVTIRGVPELAAAVGWRWAFVVLALGPVLGVSAMMRLARSDGDRLTVGSP